MLFRNKFIAICCLVLLLGLLTAGFARLQKSYPGTVTAVSEIGYRPGHKSARVRSKASYSVTATVAYTDDAGTEQTAEVCVSSIHRHDLPEVGDAIAVSKTPGGMAAHPNRTILAVGWTIAAIPGLILFCLLLGRIFERKKHS